jgi:hypothetical protein
VKSKLPYLLYGLVLGLLTVYSYALVDPNYTPVTSPVWEVFRNIMIQLGYYQRNWSFIIYIILIGLLFIFQWLFLRTKQVSIVHMAFGIFLCTLLAFPFLSHDFFNYLFDAKIITHYHQSPYQFAAWHFTGDPDLRFMHWVQRTYPYGPVFLALTVIPSFLAIGKFMLSFIFFKVMWGIFFVLSAVILEKTNRKAAVFYITSPLMIVEGLINSHNDLIAVSCALIALYYVSKRKHVIFQAIFFLLSIGIKYTSTPFVFLITRWKYAAPVVMVGFIATLWYSYSHVGIQQWYFLNIMILLPFLVQYIIELSVLSIFLLVSYYPYIVLGGWDNPEKVVMKEQIIFAGIVITILIFIMRLLARHYFLRSK